MLKKYFFSSFISVEETYYVLPWGRKCIWTILFVAMAITSTFGNLIVIWIVMSQKRMRTVTNYFIGKCWVCFWLGVGRVGFWLSILESFYLAKYKDSRILSSGWVWLNSQFDCCNMDYYHVPCFELFWVCFSICFRFILSWIWVGFGLSLGWVWIEFGLSLGWFGMALGWV